MAAFACTLEYGIGWAETDLRPCSTGKVVLLHDERVDRTTDGSGSVHDLSLHEIQRLDAGSWFGPQFAGEPIPTLSALFERFGDQLVYLLEIRDPGRVEAERGLSVRSTHVHSDDDMQRILGAGVVRVVHSDARILRDYIRADSRPSRK